MDSEIHKLKKSVGVITSDDYCAREMDTVGSEVGDALETVVHHAESYIEVPEDENQNLSQMLESLTDYQRKNFKVVLIREDNLAEEWAAYVCKTDVFIDTGTGCSVNDMKLADVLNTLMEYGMKVEIEYRYFNDVDEEFLNDMEIS